MKKIILLMACSACLFSVFAQDASSDLIDKGVKLHDKGNYAEAITYYTRALAIDSNSSIANCEMANTCIAMEKYQKAIYHADRVISINRGSVALAYTLKGTAYDMLHQSDSATATYRQGIRKFPDNYLLHYNLGITQFNNKQYVGAEQHAVEALKINMGHAGSHLLLANCTRIKGQRSRSMLSLYYFLLLQPSGRNAAGALAMLDEMRQQGVTKESDTKINISFSPSEDPDFSAAELSLSLMEAVKNEDKYKKMSPQQLFVDNTNSFFSILGKLKDDKEHADNFWWSQYVPFFYALSNSKQTEAFCYYISMSREDKKITDWISTHKPALDAFSRWYKDYYK